MSGGHGKSSGAARVFMRNHVPLLGVPCRQLLRDNIHCTLFTGSPGLSFTMETSHKKLEHTWAQAPSRLLSQHSDDTCSVGFHHIGEAYTITSFSADAHTQDFCSCTKGGSRETRCKIARPRTNRISRPFLQAEVHPGSLSHDLQQHDFGGLKINSHFAPVCVKVEMDLGCRWVW